MSHGKKSKRKKHKKHTKLERTETDEHLNKRPPHVDITGRVEANFPPDLIEKYDAAGEKEEGWNHKIFVAEIVAAILLAASVAAVAWQGFLLRESNKVNHEALVSVQRPFIVFDKIQIQKTTVRLPSGDQRQWRIWISWLNSGTTPAPRTLHHFDLRVLPEEPTDKIFRGNPVDASFTVGYIGPKLTQESAGIYMPESFFLTDPNSTIFSAEKKFFWGWAAYIDVFSDTTLHLTEFCQQLVGVAVSPTANSPILVTKDCKHHNCTDEYCADFKDVINMVAETLKKPN
jgi:hypothetical protein